MSKERTAPPPEGGQETGSRKRRAKPKRVTSAREDRQRASDGASAEARQVASVVLAVLGGSLGPTEAAAALGRTPTQYYKLEARAIQGLLEACEPRARGRQRNPEKELEAMTASHRKLERECARLQALVRALGRTSGVKRKAAPASAKGSAGKSGTAPARNGKSRGRKPSVRALRLAEQLAENGQALAAEGGPVVVMEPSPPPRPSRPRAGRRDAETAEARRAEEHGTTGTGRRAGEQAERVRGGQGAAEGDPRDGGR